MLAFLIDLPLVLLFRLGSVPLVYRALVRPVLLRLEPETGHRFVIWLLSRFSRWLGG